MQQELTIIGNQDEVISVQSIANTLIHNKNMALRAVTAITQLQQQLPQPETIKDVEIQKVDDTLNEYIVRGKESIKVMNEKRSQITKRFDEIKKEFTAAEKQVSDCVDKLVGYRNSLNLVVLKRQEERQREQERKLAYENAKQKYIAAVVRTINSYHHAQLKDSIDALYVAFYNQTLETIQEWGKTMRAWLPMWQPFAYTPPLVNGLSQEDAAILKAQVEQECYNNAKLAFEEKMIEEKEKILAMIPGRIQELQQAAIDKQAYEQSQARIEEEKKLRDEKMLAEQQENLRRIEQEKEQAKMNTLFDSALDAKPVVQTAKGSSILKAYKATTHKAIIAIIQYWVSNHAHLLTVEELTKKFSFMFTAANKALNDEGKKIEAEGLIVIDEIVTRATRAKKK